MTAEPWATPVFEAIARLLNARTGLTFTPNRWVDVETGIQRAISRSGISDPSAFLASLESGRTALDELVLELTVGETYFFRDSAQFELIRSTVLPDFRERCGAGHAIRSWSAGCASGEEPYSMAILFDQEGLLERAHVLATDISPAALARARLASYAAWSLRGVSPSILQQYFEKVEDRWLLAPGIRRPVSFAYLNLAQETYPSFATDTWGLDLILCRNVFIYFDQATVKQVGARLLACLSEGGWLILGASDPLLEVKSPFEVVVTTAGVAYRRKRAGEASSLTHRAASPLERAASPLAQAASPLAQAASPLAQAASPLAQTASPLAQAASPLAQASSPPDCAASPSPLHQASNLDPLALAREAYARGDYHGAVQLTRDLSDAEAAVLHVRALANLKGPLNALRAAEDGTARHPFTTELHFLQAVLLMDLRQLEAAEQAARRTLYLDRSLAIAHFILGSIQSLKGDVAGARRSFRNTRDLCVARPPDELVPMADAERAGQLARAAKAQLELLATSGSSS